jgi:hypothetical protein
MPYTSAVPRFIRERYILVEAIVIVTKLGIWNICVAETRKKLISSLLLVASKDVPCPLYLVVFTEIEFHQYPSVMDRRKSKITIQIQTKEHLCREIAMSGKRNGQKE